jgi:hypothetical protein
LGKVLQGDFTVGQFNTSAEFRQPRIDTAPRTDAVDDMLVEALNNLNAVLDEFQTRGGAMSAVAIIDHARGRLCRVLAVEDRAISKVAEARHVS